jgi:hypothetical protein
MKYIITESQYDNLFTDKNYRLVAKMWDQGMNTSEIAELLNIKESIVIYLLREKEIHIDCAFAETLLPILYRTSLINKNFRSGDETLRLDWSFGAFITFNYDNPKYELRGYATPYWNKECVTPVDSSYFLDKETDEYEDNNDSFGMITDNTPSSFNSIQELIDFLNNVYPKELFRTIQKIIKKRMGFN